MDWCPVSGEQREWIEETVREWKRRCELVVTLLFLSAESNFILFYKKVNDYSELSVIGATPQVTSGPDVNCEPDAIPVG